ncbi:MAG: 30S ribosomal protein S1 [Limnochordia bacterium]|jgi:ribosomal protein S1
MTEVRDDRERETEVTTASEQAESTAASEPGTEAEIEAQVEANVEQTGEQAVEACDEKEDAPTEQAASEPASETQYDATFATLEPGKIVTGRVVQMGEDEVMVDVGYKSEGRIPLHELGLRSGQQPADILKVGDEVDVLILKVDDAEGSVVLSKRRADTRLVWQKLEEMYESGAVLEAVVTERVKGGLLVDVGVRGFVPASHVARNYVENLDKYVGEELRLKIVEIDRQRNNVVLSRKLVLEEEYLKAKEETFETLQEGAVVEGVVRRITDFGAFVDIGSGVEGLLHVSEMAWSRVKHPSDVVQEDDVINVMVLNVDRENERISLSLKETLPDPWETVDQRYVVGDIVEGEVTRVVDFGAFVKLEDGIEGLVHISQMADHHVTNPSEVVSPGDVVSVKIVSLDDRARRIGLSIKEAQPRPVRLPKEAFREQQTSFGDTGEGNTLGDRFPGLSSYFDDDEDDEDDDEQ